MSEICILYCLTKREMTIYSVRKFISKFFGAYTRPSHGTIYPSLKKLLSENYVSVQEMLSEGGKKSSYYAITEKGRKYLTEIMLSDLSDNPSVLLNEINIRISASGVLNNDNKQYLYSQCIKSLELYSVEIQRFLDDKYSNFDESQKAIMSQTKKQAHSLSEFLKNLQV